MHITVRIINSFEFSTVFYMVVEVDESTTLLQIQEKINE